MTQCRSVQRIHVVLRKLEATAPFIPPEHTTACRCMYVGRSQVNRQLKTRKDAF